MLTYALVVIQSVQFSNINQIYHRICYGWYSTLIVKPLFMTMSYIVTKQSVLKYEANIRLIFCKPSAKLITSLYLSVQPTKTHDVQFQIESTCTKHCASWHILP